MTDDAPLKFGDYVIATKYADGDPRDPWAVGYFAGPYYDRFLVANGQGKSIRAGGFRAVRRITPKVGCWLLSITGQLDNAPERVSLWGLLQPMFDRMEGEDE